MTPYVPAPANVTCGGAAVLEPTSPKSQASAAIDPSGVACSRAERDRLARDRRLRRGRDRTLGRAVVHDDLLRRDRAGALLRLPWFSVLELLD